MYDFFFKPEKLYRNKMRENAKYYIVHISPSPNFVFPTKYFTDYSEKLLYTLSTRKKCYLCPQYSQ